MLIPPKESGGGSILVDIGSFHFVGFTLFQLIFFSTIIKLQHVQPNLSAA